MSDLVQSESKTKLAHGRIAEVHKHHRLHMMCRNQRVYTITFPESMDR